MNLPDGTPVTEKRKERRNLLRKYLQSFHEHGHFGVENEPTQISLADEFELIQDLSRAEARVKALSDALQIIADDMCCACNLIHFVGEIPPCKTCKLRALLEGVQP